MTRTKTKVAAGRLKMKDTGRERPAQDPAGRRARDYDGPPVAGTVVLLPVDRIAPSPYQTRADEADGCMSCS